MEGKCLKGSFQTQHQKLNLDVAYWNCLIRAKSCVNCHSILNGCRGMHAVNGFYRQNFDIVNQALLLCVVHIFFLNDRPEKIQRSVAI